MSNLDWCRTATGAKPCTIGVLVFVLLILIGTLGCRRIDHTNGYPFPENSPCPRDVIVSELNDGSIRFCGDINPASVGAAIEHLERSSNKRLIIDSIGGSTQDAIVLAQYIRENEIDVFVNLVCLSACSQFLVISAPRVAFRDASIVGFHDTQYATNIILGSKSISAGMIEEADSELAFYRSVGVDDSLSTRPLASLNPECIVNRMQYAGSGRLLVKMKGTYIMPDQESFARYYNGTMLTDWPSREAVERELLERYRGKLNVLYDEFNTGELALLPDCEIVDSTSAQ
jgi:hypothetical protein